MNSIDYQFKKWNPKQYLQDYFTDKPKFESTIKFIVEQTKLLPNNLKIIDIGCGPTACYWSALSRISKNITLADFKKDNLTEIKKWVNKKQDSFNWNHYSNLAVKYIGDNNLDVYDYEALARNKVSKYILCNLFNDNPLSIKNY